MLLPFAADRLRKLRNLSVVARIVLVAGVLAMLTGAGLAIVASVVYSPSPFEESIAVEAEVPVTAINRGTGAANNSPLIALDPTEPSFAVLANRLDAPDFSCALQVSGNGGRGWLPANPVPVLPEGAEKCYGPEVAFDRDGVLYYLFVGLQGTGNEPMGVFLTTSSDRARTFSPPRQVLGPLNFAVRMMLDRSLGDKGRVHLIWLQATSDPALGGFGPPPNPILAAHSDDGGNTFSTPIQVSDPARERVVAPALALGPDHAVHIAYYDLKNDVRDYQGLEGPTWEGTWSLVVATSRDGGRNFGGGVVVDDGVVPHERVMLIFTMPPPALAAGQGGRICASWTDGRHGDADVLVSCSSQESGSAWGQPHRVNDDEVGNGHPQYLPALSMAPDGRIHVIFYDRREDFDNIFNHVYYSSSADEGRRFGPNIKLTSEPSNAFTGQEYVNPSAQGLVEFGSRLALVSTESELLAAWADTRNSLPSTTGQDVFVTEVRLPTDDVRKQLMIVSGALFVVGLLVVVVVYLHSRRVERRG